MEYRKAMWLTPFLLVIHNFEEYLTMPTFISSHWQGLPAFINNITPPSSDQFSVALVTVTVVAFLLTFLGSKSEAKRIGMYVAVGIQAVLLLNAIQHIGGSIWLGIYTPGVLTSIILYLPLLSYLILRARKGGYI